MKKKQYFELGKFSLVLAQIVFGTRIITHIFSSDGSRPIELIFSSAAFAILLVGGILLIGKGSDNGRD